MIQTTQTRTIQPQDLFRLRFLQGARLSPDGHHVAYVVSHTDGIREEYATIWLMDLRRGQSRPLTAGLWRDTNPQWSPDGVHLAFVSTRTGAPQIHVVAIDGGEPRAITSVKRGIGGGPLWSPEGERIAFTTGPEGEARDPSQPYRVTRRIYRIDGAGYVDDWIQGVCTVPVQGGPVTRLVANDYHMTLIGWSPDGTRLLCSASLRAESEGAGQSLILVDTEGRVQEIPGASAPGVWTPDGNRVVYIGQRARRLGTKPDLSVTDRTGGRPECRTQTLGHAVGFGLQGDSPYGRNRGDICPTRDGTAAFVPVQEGGSIHIYRVALSGPESWQPVVTGDRACMLQDADDRRLLYIVSTMNDPFQLYTCDLDGSNERRLTNLNEDLFAEVRLPTVERLLFPGTDGVQVEGWIMKPPMGFPPYPTVLCTHGGPYSAWGHLYSFDFQMLAGAGYAVLFANQRGSLGYGEAFSTPIYGDLGHLDYEDIMAAVDHVVARGIADPERLGCCGISYGGFMTTWIVGHTDRFKAAIPENPVTNWVSLYGVKDLPLSVSYHLGGQPWEVPDIYHRLAPITHAHKCKTPTLLIQSESDLACPVDQSEQFYATLKANGCIVEMLRIPNSSHMGTMIGPLVARQAHNEALLGWLDKYVRGEQRQGEGT